MYTLQQLQNLFIYFKNIVYFSVCDGYPGIEFDLAWTGFSCVQQMFVLCHKGYIFCISAWIVKGSRCNSIETYCSHSAEQNISENFECLFLPDQRMDEEIPNFVETPWDCEHLDPFRDDPNAVPGRQSEEEIGAVSQSELSDNYPVDNEPPKCSCQNCPQMLSREEQVCCRDLKMWQQEYKSEGICSQPLSCTFPVFVGLYFSEFIYLWTHWYIIENNVNVKR